MIELPKGSTKGNRELVKSMLIVSRPKVGKTRALLDLPDSILIDMEDSSDYFDGVSINVQKECSKQGIGPITALRQIAKQIRDANKEKGDYVYKYGIIDTISKVEEYAESYAVIMYKKTPQGKDYRGNNVITDLDYGGGYLYLREAVKYAIEPFFSLFETVIFTGHVKDSSINIKGKSLGVADINLTGKIKTIITGRCDAIGTMYRDEENTNQNILSFKTTASDIITGARPSHLSNKEFIISELNSDTDKLTTHWNEVFTNLNEAVIA